MGNMEDMELGPVFPCQVQGVKESDVGILRKIRTVKDIFIFNHNNLS
jgi:hypothetical protein